MKKISVIFGTRYETIRLFLLFIIFFIVFLCDLTCQNENIILSSLGGWYYYIKNALTCSFIVTGIHLLCGRYGRCVTLAEFVYFFVFAVLALFLRCCFGMTLNNELFFIIRASSVNETVSFLKTVCSFGIIASSFLVIVMFCSCCYFIVKGLPKWGKNIRSLALGGLLLAIGLIDNKVWNGPGLFIAKISSFSLWKKHIESKEFFERMLAMVNQPQLPEGIYRLPDLEKAPMGVIVIGESATRNHWSLYGYERLTTPNMDAIRDELFVWDDVITAWPRTTQALCYLLTMATRESPNDFKSSIVDIYKAAGYKVSYYCCQSQWGNSEGDIAKLFYHADHKVSLNDVLTRKIYDDDLLMLLKEHLDDAKTDQPEIIFLHLVGSHFPPKDYVPKDWHPFPLGTMQNDYDNSIMFTDKLLGNVHRQLLELKRPIFLFYISDHGESPSASHWRDLSNMDTWEIPMIFWMSKEYMEWNPKLSDDLKQTKKKPPLHTSLQADELFYGLCSIAGVRWKNFPLLHDFTHPSFRHKAKRLLMNQVYLK